MHAALVAISAATPERTSHQLRATTAKSSDMPTPRKKRPSSRPRKGSISASSWWRKEDSERRTPATNAPIAIDSPPASISSAAPRTTNSAAAVITSRARVAARMRKSGLSKNRPTATNAASAASGTPMVCHSGFTTSPAACSGERKATMASSGTISKSSKSKMETMRCPRGLEISPRSFSTCMTIAVEVSTKPPRRRNSPATESRTASQRRSAKWRTPPPANCQGRKSGGAAPTNARASSPAR